MGPQGNDAKKHGIYLGGNAEIYCDRLKTGHDGEGQERGQRISKE